MLLVLVSLSVLGLFVGALLPAIGRVHLPAGSMLSGVALGMLPALVLARLLPHTFESLGPWALLLAAVGFGLVTASHHAGERVETGLGSALVLPALLLHAVTDGAALAMSSTERVGSAGGLLATAAILHRIPEGLFVASRRKPAGLRGALWAALPLALATVAGALVGERVFETLPDSVFDGVLALGAGAMLRLLSHSHEADEAPQPRAHALAGLGFLGGLSVVLAVPGPHDILQSAQPRELSIAVSLLPLFIESAPALLLGLLVAAALRTWPGSSVSDPGAGAGTARGLWHGFRRPLGDRAALVAAEGWLSAGRAPAYSLGFIATGLGLSAESAALSFRLLGSELGVARLVGGLLLAAGVALAARGALTGRYLPPSAAGRVDATHFDAGSPHILGHAMHARATHDDVDRLRDAPATLVAGSSPPAPASSGSFRSSRALAGVAHASAPLRLLGALRALLDEHGAGLCLGLLAAAALEAGLASDWLGRVGSPWGLLLAAAAAGLCQMSGLAAVPLAAVLVHKGASVGAALIFVWLTPLLRLSLLGWLQRSLGPGAAPRFAARAIGLALLFGFAADRWLSARHVPEVHPLVEHAHAPWELVCALALGCLLLASLLRLGPRGFAAGLRAAPHAHGTHAEAERHAHHVSLGAAHHH